MPPKKRITLSASFKRAYERNPEMIDNALRAIAQDPVSSEGTLDYITDMALRRDLYAEIQIFLTGNSHLEPINHAALAVLMVAPIQFLRETWNKLKAGEHPRHEMERWVRMLIRHSPVAIKDFVVRGGRSPGGETPAPTQTHSASVGGARKAAEAKRCKQRDGNQCVLSGVTEPEAAHIFPHATLQKRKFDDLRQLLVDFWGPEKADTWAQLYEDENVSESPQNLLSLTPTLHKWFDDAKMALKPLHQTEDSITVQIHWLKETGFKPGNDIPRRSLDDILARGGLSDKTTWGSKVFFRSSGLPLLTGQTFTITAESPDLLPSFDLLELSWDLLRIGSMCGAAEEDDTGDEDQFPEGDKARVDWESVDTEEETRDELSDAWETDLKTSR